MWTLHRIDLVSLKHLTDTMVSTPCRSSLVIGLVGTLGAGKTRFCQELGTALGMLSGAVTSPTFTMIRSYDVTHPSIEMPRRWHHLDLYRVSDEDEWWELGVEELWDEEATWTIIEWADRFEALMPPETIWIEIQSLQSEQTKPNDPTPYDSCERTISFRCRDADNKRWLSAVEQNYLDRKLRSGKV